MDITTLKRIAPSNPDYLFRAADLMGLTLNHDDVNRILARAYPGAPGAPGTSINAFDDDATIRLLAAILKGQKKNNALYRPAPFTLAAYARQMVFASNPARSYFLLQNVGNGDIMIVFEEGPADVQDMTNDTGQLIGQQTRAVRVVAGGYFEPLTAPTNAITLFTLNDATNGLCIEG